MRPQVRRHSVRVPACAGAHRLRASRLLPQVRQDGRQGEKEASGEGDGCAPNRRNAGLGSGREATGGHPRWGLLTLTVRHSGDPATDRRRILAGFTSLRKWLHRHFHRAPPYALLWEITPGEDGRGHVHAHVALQIPALSKPKFSEFRNVWLSAVPESRQFNYQLAKKGPVGAARYLAKYLSKTVSVAEFGPELAALAVASQYGQRVVSASQRFWIASTAPKCRTCHQLWELVDKPQPLVRMNALLVAQLDAGVTGYPRGPTQVAWPFALAVEGDDGDVARGRGLRCGLG